MTNLKFESIGLKTLLTYLIGFYLFINNRGFYRNGRHVVVVVVVVVMFPPVIDVFQSFYFSIGTCT